MIAIGTSGYNYPEWRGTFYPEKFPTGKMLPYYAERFSTVEVNYTFYRMPNAKTIAGWVAETPASFSFTLKAPQRITHFARLRDIGDPLRYFLDTAAGLGPKLGPVLFQLPPNFKKDLVRLGGLLDQLPAGLRCALEFRHESWFADDVYERLRAANAALCVADTEEDTTPVEVDRGLGLPAPARPGLHRRRSRGVGRRIQELGARWRDTYVYFKHEEAGTGPAFARQLRELLDR